MLNWIIENKDWLFSGVAVSGPIALIGWYLARKTDKRTGPVIDNSVRQSHTGIGDNVGRDKISNGR
ncbi:MAG: hypothetical protein Q3M24_11880 [Candidatus Electrothrix aestuarii]|uniref:Uncharacterized protein n=1 Tax=Candidatus Electrothrix aestuarii TaxID=3062594 RepID=A0AAU8LPH5_9BACT|nr:hypothetical protein [Candidatus Electrothrix aestuarii]